ncbi:pilus assembly protein N-terminal domain-containing protein [Oricola sp.]|uniref:pilus assembly protein N-terminal domain-containing protein n=1 Tax=Oricola sp. TaxID=1979950 RepID=UPI0025CC22EC|nr:pilus assembly protein N-terminal domain-containing protein [Oricola sp.]MCI5078030.1 pilus assembly protein N-terminal domain-containing protein [Oricola sp.]
MIKGIGTGLAAITMASALIATPAAFAGENFLAMNTVPEPGIRVVLNQAKIVKLSQAAATVIVGNPEIADATVRDAQTLILTGRGFGQTNLVILDAGGNPILDERISVSRENGTALRIYRQANIETLSCEPYCEKAYLTEAEVQSIRAVRDANTIRKIE